jgi:CheY-like chemotaxis protein/anti-sigma regulatory factor (Ser/Thr protein kinase)
VRGLSQFSRAEEGDIRPLDVASTLDFALAIVAHEVEARARVIRDYNRGAVVLASESRMSQVFVNLLINAAQAITDGAPGKNEIRVRVTPRGERVEISISDTGSGIAPEHLPRIFDPFFTTKPPGVGVGLGLSICHGIVRDLKGDMRVSSSAAGTTFDVILPRADCDATPPPAIEGKRTPSSESPDTRPSILVVDDEERYASSLRLLLSDDYEVTVCHSGRSALAQIHKGARFDAILCDLMMPEMTGMTFHEELERVAPDAGARVIFLTGGPTTDRARAFVDRPDICSLEKPTDIETLTALINTTIARHQPHSE